jgi:uncharacterized lipoprotein YddW (UPF0748 family)
MNERTQRPRAILFLLTATISISAALASATATDAIGRTAPDEVRALWVTRATLTSPARVTEMVNAAASAGFNTLLVQVRGRGDAYYRSSLEPRPTELVIRPDFDPLAEVLARARPAAIAVHAWINVNLVSSAVELPSSPQHIVYRHPEWLMVPRGLVAEMLGTSPDSPEYLVRLARWTRTHNDEVEGLYTSPIHAGATAHIADIAAEVVRNYAVDGIHLDYARFPNADFDYSPAAVREFTQTVKGQLSGAEQRRLDVLAGVDPLAYTSRFPERWQAFRQSRLNGLLMRVRTAIKSANPRAIISAAVAPELDTAVGAKMQDWRTWLEQGLVDVLCPMTYTQDAELFERQVAAAADLAGPRPVWAGVAAYRLSGPATLRHIDLARRSRAAGVVLFSYDALVSPPNSASSLAALARAAFAAGSQ